MKYTYLGQVAELPSKGNKNGNIVLKNNKVYLYLEGWEELLINDVDVEFEIREVIRKAEDCKLKTELLQLFKRIDEDRIIASNF